MSKKPSRNKKKSSFVTFPERKEMKEVVEGSSTKKNMSKKEKETLRKKRKKQVKIWLRNFEKLDREHIRKFEGG